MSRAVGVRVLETSQNVGVARDSPPFVKAGFGTLLPLKRKLVKAAG
jgi:hypothetical protein